MTSSSSTSSRRHSDAARLRPGDIVTCRVTRADEYQAIGLQLRQQQQQQQQQRPANGKNHYYYIIHKVEGLCNNLPLQVGDELVELNGARVSEYDDLEHLEQVLAEAKTVEMKVRRRQCPKQEEKEDEELDDDEEESLQDGDKENTTTVAATVGSSRSLMSGSSSNRSLRSTGTGSVGSRRRQATPTTSPRNKKHLQIEYSSNDNDDDDDSEEHYDHFERPELLRKESYDGSSVDDSNSSSCVVVFRPGSAAKLANLHDTKAAKLQHQNVFIMHESTKRPGNFECELEDGSRIAVSEKHLAAISEEDEATFQPYVPGRKQPQPHQHNQHHRPSNSSSSLGSSRSCNGGFQNMLATPNLIEPGDVMKIRGLKKQAKMNGTLVEILRPAEQHRGRWECVLCDDPDRVIAVMSENLRHIM
jgi:hypothetical protein